MRCIFTLIIILLSQATIAESKMDNFFEAAQYGDIKMLRKLVSNDSRLVNSKDQYGFSALHFAITEDNAEIINFLVKSGLNVNVQNNDGIAPLHIVGYPEIAELLIKLGANIELEDNNGNTPLLIHSTEEDGFEIMEVLLVNGANPKHKNKVHETAKGYANSRHEIQKIELIDEYLNN